MTLAIQCPGSFRASAGLARLLVLGLCCPAAWALCPGQALASPTEHAERFLASLDPGMAADSGAAGSDAKELIAAAAKAAGVDLSSLGPDWYGKFASGSYKPSPADPALKAQEDGYFVYEDAQWACFAMPLGSGVKKEDVAVQRDGKDLALADFEIEPAPDGAAVMVKVRNTGGFHKGAVIRAVCGGRAHSAKRPPDEVHMSLETEIRRDSEKTRIVMKPKVEQKDPQGRDRSPEPGKGPGGEGKTDVNVKDEDGFFETLFKTLGNAAISMGLGLGTGLLLNELSSDNGGSKHVSADESDGSYTIEVPNDAYDQCIRTIQARNPSYGAAEVALSGQPVVMESRAASQAKQGPRISSCWAIGGSVNCLKPGQTVVFRVEGAGSCPGIAETSVELSEEGAAAGFMTVVAVSGTDKAFEVSARLPSSVSTVSGDLEASVGTQKWRTNRVPLVLSRESVSLGVSAKVVSKGGSIRITLNNPSGGGIKGALSISGPAYFSSNGGKSMDVDTANSRAEYSAVTTSEGTVDIKFKKR